MAPKKNSAPETITDFIKIEQGQFDCCIVGEGVGILLNRVSQKAARELLMPRGRKSAIERATSLKHVPVDEYRASPYTLSDGPTLLAVRSAAIKGAMATAALDIPGAKKAQVERLVWVEGNYTSLYGVPRLHMDIVRSADMNRTPDVRTRACVSEWACRVRIGFSRPLITPQAVLNLLAAAGITAGIGDNRPEKGGPFGKFRVVDPTDPAFKRIVKDGARAAQVRAMEHPVPYDAETAELLAWFDTERERRQKEGRPVPKPKKVA